MDCIICGAWFGSAGYSKICSTCERAMKQLRLDMLPDRLRELAQADRLLGKKVYEPNKRGFVSTYEVISVHISYCSVLVGWNLIDGIYSNLNGFEISALGKSVFLTRTEAESALRREQDG